MENQNPNQAQNLNSEQTQIPPQAQQQNIPPTPLQQTPPQTPSFPPQQQTTGTAMTIVTIILFLLFYPVGLLVMWFGTKWPKWIKLLLTLLPIVLIITGVLLVIFAAKIATPIPEIQPANTTKSVFSVTPSPATIIDNRVINNDGGYSFMLPATWKVKISSYSKTDTIFGENILNDLGTGDIRVTTSYKSLSEALSHDNPKIVSNPTQTTIDGVPAVTENLSGSDGIIKIEGKATTVYKDGKTYTIEVLSNDPADISKYQEILSSFKFSK